MHMLLPGYPKTNPILKGVASLCAGIPLEEVMEQRERDLPTPLHFAQASVEAVCWLPPESPLAAGLISQAVQAFRQLGAQERVELLGQAGACAQRGAGHAPSLVAQWSEVVGA